MKWMACWYDHIRICLSVICLAGLGLPAVASVSTGCHPCLLLLRGEEEKIAALAALSPGMQEIHARCMQLADDATTDSVSQYRLDASGKRLLSVSRKSLQKLFALSYAYRMTRQGGYVQAATKELRAVCAFPDWHPSHYLDVAEMAMGVAIAYDWLYDVLPVETRRLAACRLEQYALDTALDAKNRYPFQAANNWCQVCNAGILFAGLALRDIAPEKMAMVYAQYKGSIVRALEAYEPDGVYPEGPSYWDYGTSFNVLLNYVLEQNGYEAYEGRGGFKKTCAYYVHAVSPLHQYFNYSDCGTRGAFSIAPFYFAAMQHDPSLLWWELQHIQRGTNRLMPAALVFAKDLDVSSVPVPAEKSWTGGGCAPVYLTRSAWQDAENAAFFGVKGGKATNNHGHMDAGTFVYEVNGERWAVDLGAESYAAVEAAGVTLWEKSQQSGRWSLLKYINQYHNVITLNNEKFKVDGLGTIVSTFDNGRERGAELDLTPCYHAVERVTRRIALVNEKDLEILDVVCPDKDADMVWTMVTEKTTEVTVEDRHTLLLTRNGKHLRVTIQSAVPVLAGTWPCKSSTSYEQADATCVGFKAQLPAREASAFTVTLRALE